MTLQSERVVGGQWEVQFAVAVTLVVILVSRLAHTLTGTPFMGCELLIPIVVSAYRGGLRPGLVALGISLGALFLFGAAGLESYALLAINGSIVSWLSHRLIADRRRAAGADEQFTRLFDHLPMPLAVIRVADLRYAGVNAAFLATFEQTRERVVDHSALEFALYADAEERERMIADLRRDGAVSDRELHLRTGRGEARTIMASVVNVMVNGEPHYLGAFSDVTARVTSEAALRESEARFRDVTEAIHGVFWLTDPAKHEMLYISPAYEKIWGRSCASILAHPDSWLEAIHPDDHARVVDAVRTRQHTGQYDEQYRIVRPDGAIRTVRDRAFVVRDDAGNALRIAGLAEDLTERTALEEQLRQAQKLESLGMLAGGIAHDFNNMLAVIASCTGLLAESSIATGEDRELVDEIDHAVTRATALTRQLLAFSRRQVIEPVVLDVNACVNETRRMLRRMVGEDIVLTTSLEPELRPVRVDAGYLVQVIMNLVVNARDAMPTGGMLDLTTRNIMLDESFGRVHPGAFQGPAVMLAVRDTGCGMPADVLARIFEPFFTTKPVGRGTGMGLSVVRGIIEQAGGFLEVASEIGAGTTFRVYLPALDAAADELAVPVAGMAIGVETVLVVDDDEHVRRAACRALRARGFTVLEAATGERALATLETHPEIALLVTDVVMPGMDGRQLVDAARVQRPALALLFISGYTDDAIVRHGAGHGGVELLEKPFRLESLAAKVRHVLDSRQPTA